MAILEFVPREGSIPQTIPYNIKPEEIKLPWSCDVTALKEHAKYHEYEDLTGRYPYVVGSNSYSYVDHYVAEVPGVRPEGRDRLTECPKRTQVYKMTPHAAQVYWHMNMLNIPVPMSWNEPLRYQHGIKVCAHKANVDLSKFKGVIIIEEFQLTRPNNHVEQKIFTEHVRLSKTIDTGDYPPLPGEASRMTSNFLGPLGLNNLEKDRRPVSYIQVVHFIKDELLDGGPKFIPAVGLVIGKDQPDLNLVHPYSHLYRELKDADWGHQKDNLLELRYRSNKHKKLYLPLCVDGTGTDELVEINSVPQSDPNADDDVIEIRSSTSHKGNQWTQFRLHKDIQIGKTKIQGRMTKGSFRMFDNKLMAMNYQKFVNQKIINDAIAEDKIREEYEKKINFLEQELKLKSGELRLKDNELKHKDFEIKQVASSKMFESIRELLKVHSIMLNEKRLDKELDVKLKLAKQKNESDILTAGVRANADIRVLNRKMEHEEQKHTQSMELEYRKHELNSFKEQYLHQLKIQEEAMKMRREAIHLEADRRAASAKSTGGMIDLASKVLTTIPKIL